MLIQKFSGRGSLDIYFDMRFNVPASTTHVTVLDSLREHPYLILVTSEVIEDFADAAAKYSHRYTGLRQILLLPTTELMSPTS
ncbi:hypothetical protein J6590_065237 [Homalodisca vitripennis]|nr:hypothetical protein J6590_065237 [Homalodisca vitripennis]